MPSTYTLLVFHALLCTFFGVLWELLGETNVPPTMVLTFAGVGFLNVAVLVKSLTDRIEVLERRMPTDETKVPGRK